MQNEFEEYFNQYYRPALGYVKKRISGHHDAEDLVMSAFLSCYTHFGSFDPGKASFGTWLFVSLNNRIKNYYRDRRETEEFTEESAGGASFEEEILQAAYLDSLREDLSEALRALKEEEREIVVRKYFYSESAEEIGRRLGKSPGNVRVTLKRALDKIRRNFEQNQVRWE